MDRARSGETSDWQQGKNISNPSLAPKKRATLRGEEGCPHDYRGDVTEENAARQIGDYFLSERRLAELESPAGNIRTAVMSLLKDQPMHPYELLQKLGRSWGRAKLLFPVLQSLCDAGLVAVDVDSGWRTYWLTEGGKAELEGEAAAEVKKVTTIDVEGGPGSRPPFGR